MGERYRIRIAEMKIEGLNDPEANVIGDATRQEVGVEVDVRAGKLYEFEIESDNIKRDSRRFVKKWVEKLGGKDVIYQYDSSYHKVSNKKKIHRNSRS